MSSDPLNAPVQAVEQPSNRIIYVVARLHRFMLVMGIVQALLGIVYLLVFKAWLDPSAWFDRLAFQALVGLSLSLCLCSAAATLKVGRCMKADYTWLYTIAGAVPFIGTALVFTLDVEIRDYLKTNGLTVGILGVSPSDAVKLIS